MCIFCKIINQEIPNFKIYEDEFTYAFLDINGASIGHTLVVPKKHVTNIFDCDKDTLIHLSNTIKTVSTILKTKLNISDLNIVNNSGELAGQTVMHFHIHLIPRYENDDANVSFKSHDSDFDKLKEIHSILTQ